MIHLKRLGVGIVAAAGLQLFVTFVIWLISQPWFGWALVAVCVFVAIYGLGALIVAAKKHMDDNDYPDFPI